MKTQKSWVFGAVVMVVMASSGCLFGGTKIKSPTLQLAGLKLAGASLTGAKLSVAFNVRNVNATPLVVESFRYELSVNGTSLGTGFYPTRMELAGMADQKVTSVFDLGFVPTSSTVQSVLQQDKVHARVNCKFFIAGGTIMNYSTMADISIEK